MSETVSHVKEKHILGVLQNTMQVNISGPKEERLRGISGRLRNKEPRNSYCPPNTIKIVNFSV
jgi:hypothetical protein